MDTAELNREPASRRLLRGLLTLPAIALLLSGVLGFLTGAMLSFGPLSGLRGIQHLEFPLGDLKAMHVDREHRVYTYSGFYSRVQLYDAGGRFLAGWQIPAFKGRPQLRTDADNLLHVSAVGRHWKLVESYGFVMEDEPFERIVDTGARDSGSYELINNLIRPRILLARESRTLIQSRLHTYGLMAGPLLAWLTAVAGGLLLALIAKILPEPGARLREQATKAAMAKLLDDLRPKG